MNIPLHNLLLLIQPEDWGGDSFISVFDVVIIVGLVWWFARLYYTGEGRIGGTRNNYHSKSESRYTPVRASKKKKINIESKSIPKEPIPEETKVWERVQGLGVDNTYARFLLFPPTYLKEYNVNDLVDNKIIRVPKSLIQSEIEGVASFYTSKYEQDATNHQLRIKFTSHEIHFLQIHGVELLQGRTLCRGVAFLKNGSTLMETKQVRIEFEHDCSNIRDLLPLEMHLRKPIIRKYSNDPSYGLLMIDKETVSFIGSGKNRGMSTLEAVAILFP